ncbi:response regulator [Nodosilinea sp. LEGE 07088]|uniref:response regulator n=1 Tax=Nodosilinea sp. LEGE 07088 TaxID=2777968 RepID=UPI00187E2341|nr:response regulator [Nodosilinea sp. LEGE 07088]MBE9136391.1 response regulator [Nodosilinea sp. LEGE 07088]
MIATQISFSQPSTRPVTSSLNSPIQALQEIADKCANGYLQAVNDDVVWRIYFQDGRLQYASSSFQSLAALDYHFRCLGLKNFGSITPELSQSGVIVRATDWLQVEVKRSVIDWLCDRGFLNQIQGNQILKNLTKEAIEAFLWLTEGHYQWEQREIESVPKLNLELGDLLSYFQDRIQKWQEIGTLIASPHQRPYLFSQVSEDTSSPTLVKLSKLLRGMSIRQLALVLNQDEIAFAKLLYPFIQRGDILLRDPQQSYLKLPKIPQQSLVEANKILPTKTFKIACIDDSPTILDEMHRYLSHDEYEVTKIDDPVKAASVLFRLKPDLILMDITMPEINGYKLCGLLRNSVALREKPIVMVTGRSGLVDKARAKVAGATDYLVKPFTRGSLLAVVEKYLR